jgi:cytochrome c oxidase cbb3-type subunit I/II
MYWLRIVGGGMYMAGAILCAVNFYKTWRTRPAVLKETIVEAPALSPAYIDPPAPRSALEDKPVAELAKKIDRFSKATWHRRWERKPMLFTAWTLAAVAAASLFEIIPTFMIKANVPTIASVQPYTPLELYGRDLYVQEGCYNCHSQMIRPILPETKRYGEYSKPGEFIYDHPFQWGSRRIGPDLAREGVNNPNALWQLRHFQEPAAITPGSLMPRYQFLVERPSEFDSIQGRVNVMVTLGVPYQDKALTDATGMAKAQAQAIFDGIVKQNNGPYVTRYEQAKDENGKPLYETHLIPKRDEGGRPVLDADGKPVMEPIQEPKQDKNGKIELNADGHPIMVDKLFPKMVPIHLKPDSQALALIAYLQRVGTDLTRPPPSTAPATAAAVETQDAATQGGK